MPLQNKDFYQNLAQKLRFPSEAFIDGSFVKSAAGNVMENLNPATGQVMGTITHCHADDVDIAVAHARRVFNAGTWSKTAPGKRKAVLLKLADLIQQNKDELAVLESLDSGKPIRDCLSEVGEEIPSIFRWYAELIDKIFDKIAPTDTDACALIVKEPIGVVGLVLPWNFPLVMATWKLAPALASGCSTIVKPAEQTSMTALKLAELATEAGVPAGVINVLPGLGETTGKAIGCHNDIDAVSFTGSTDVGRSFMKYAAESNLKSIGLEMGGKSPFIVLDDAVISDEMIEHATNAAFWNSGQNCSANMRQMVARPLLEEFTMHVIEKTKNIVIGDPLDPETELGPMISEEHRDRVINYINIGKQEGATVGWSSGDRCVKEQGWYLGPTIFTDVQPRMRIAQEEIFGPVLGILPVIDMEQALEIANNTNYGLHATVFTNDLDKAFYMAQNLACGTVSVNGFTEGDIKTPFGGYKNSGSLARDKGTEALAQYTQTKTIWINLKARV